MIPLFSWIFWEFSESGQLIVLALLSTLGGINILIILNLPTYHYRFVSFIHTLLNFFHEKNIAFMSIFWPLWLKLFQNKYFNIVIIVLLFLNYILFSVHTDEWMNFSNIGGRKLDMYHYLILHRKLQNNSNLIEALIIRLVLLNTLEENTRWVSYNLDLSNNLMTTVTKANNKTNTCILIASHQKALIK